MGRRQTRVTCQGDRRELSGKEDGLLRRNKRTLP